MKNLTEGSPTRLIALFATPILLGAIFQQVYAFIDAAVVGNFLGHYYLAAIGAPAPLVFLLMGLSWGGSAGLAIPVARAYGAGDMEGVRRFFAASFSISAAIAAVITIIGAGFARELLTLTNAPYQIIDQGTIFLTVLLGGAPVTVLMNLLIASIRALGDSRTPLYFLIGSSVLNAVLVTLFVGALNMGVAGAAGATITSHAITAAGMLYVIRRKMPALALSRADWAAGLSSLKEPLRTGIPMAVQMSTVAVGSVALQIAVNGMGPTVVAAYTTVERLGNLAVVPLMSFGVAIVTYVAQNRGAREWYRIRIGVWRTCILGFGMAAVLGTFLMLFGQNLAAWFVGSDQVEVIALTRTFFLINGPLYGILAFLFVLRNAVQGMGLASMPTISGAVETAGRVIMALAVIPSLGFVGAAMAHPVAWTAGLLPLVFSWIHQRRVLRGLEQGDHLQPLPTNKAPSPKRANRATPMPVSTTQAAG